MGIEIWIAAAALGIYLVRAETKRSSRHWRILIALEQSQRDLKLFMDCYNVMVDGLATIAMNKKAVNSTLIAIEALNDIGKIAEAAGAIVPRSPAPKADGQSRSR